jgi:hypothetical protein
MHTQKTFSNQVVAARIDPTGIAGIRVTVEHHALDDVPDVSFLVEGDFVDQAPGTGGWRGLRFGQILKILFHQRLGDWAVRPPVVEALDILQIGAPGVV